ncbi:MAG: response regulator [Elusimicrobia bacterium]|nr:response regulator [Elusimicrobiota bacterium]
MGDNILLVDDDKEFRSEFRDCFGEYRITEASTAEEALAYLEKPNKIDLVLMDVKMPGMGGLKALRLVHAAAPGAAVVIMTGYSSKDVVIEALRGEASNYIEKPFDVEKARAIIESVLVKAGGEEEVSLTDGKGKVEAVKNFLRRNCLKKVRLQDAAAAVYISPKHLSRIFKAHSGIGFNQFYLNCKIEKAKEILRDTSYTVDHISEKLGYGTTQSFIRQFKKMAGTTPSGFRAKAAAAPRRRAPVRPGRPRKSRRK